MITEVPSDSTSYEAFAGRIVLKAPSREAGTASPQAVLAQQTLRRSADLLARAAKAALATLARGGSWALGVVKTRQTKKRLRLCDTLSLGEKRFIAVVQIDGEQFLVGGSSTSISMLAQLQAPTFSSVLKQSCSEERVQA